MLARIVMIAWPLAPSSAAVGSSARIADGSATIARAIATRCCSPPLKSRGNAPILCPSPTRSRTWRDLAGAAAALAADVEGQPHVLLGGQRREQMKRLKNEPDMLPADPGEPLR